MRIKRIPSTGMHAVCYDCHNRAEFEITFGRHQPALHLCLRDARYLSGFLGRRIAEHEADLPIPKPRFEEE